MKTKLLLLFGILLSITSGAQTLDCKKFKTGKFYYPQIPDAGYSIREKKKQTSYYKNNSTVTWGVKWTNSCSFELTFVSATNNGTVFKKGDKIMVTITATDEDCYTFEAILFNAKFPNGNKVPPGQMCLKKD